MAKSVKEFYRGDEAQIRDSIFTTSRLIHKWMIRHDLSVEEFLDLDKAYQIIRYIGISYGPYHLTGDEGNLQDIDEYVAECRAAK